MYEYEEAWLSTLYRKQFHFLQPIEDEIDILDIAHSTSLLCRFGGHCRQFYSVAEHSVIVSTILQREGASTLTQLGGLLHDAEEAYLPDIPAPIKRVMPEADKIYENIRGCIYRKYGIEQADWKHVEDIDSRLCITEAKLLGLWNEDWAYVGKPLPTALHLYLPYDAERAFIYRFTTLLTAALWPEDKR